MTAGSIDISVEGLQSLIASEGFELFGVLPIGKSETYPALQKWIDAGMHADMDWMSREDAMEKREDPRNILSTAKYVITLAFNYAPYEISQELLDDPSRGIIARYALYDDYHKVIKKRLVRLGKALSVKVGGCDWKAYVDTGPFLEREWAERAGLGFTGRNSLLINNKLGSYLFLSEILVSAELPVIQYEKKGSCARCTNCMDKCPTGAIVADRTVDARKCISYLTIEHKGSIPEQFRPLMRNRIYGCDICQEVCPWNQNRGEQEKSDFKIREQLVAPKLEQLLIFDEDEFRERFAGSPIRRAKREGFMRNVSIALGNFGASAHADSADAKQLLHIIQKHDDSAVVQEHVDWALKRCA